MEESRSKVIDIHCRKSVVVESIWEQELRNEIAKQASGVIEEKNSKMVALDSEVVKRCRKAHEAHHAVNKQAEDFHKKVLALNEQTSTIIAKNGTETAKAFKKLQAKLNKTAPKIEGISLEAQNIHAIVMHAQKPIRFDGKEEISEVDAFVEKINNCLDVIAKLDFQKVYTELGVEKGREREITLLCTHKKNEIQMFLSRKDVTTASLDKLYSELDELEQVLANQEKANVEKSALIEVAMQRKDHLGVAHDDLISNENNLGDLDELLAKPPTLNDEIAKEIKTLDQYNVEIDQAKEDNQKTEELIGKSRQKTKEHWENMMQDFEVLRMKIEEEVSAKEENATAWRLLYEKEQRRGELWFRLETFEKQSHDLQIVIQQLDGGIAQDKNTIADCENEIQVLASNTYQGPPEADAIYHDLRTTETRVEKVVQEITALNEQIRATEEQRLSMEKLIESKQVECASEVNSKEKEFAALVAANNRKKQKLILEFEKQQEVNRLADKSKHLKEGQTKLGEKRKMVDDGKSLSAKLEKTNAFLNHNKPHVVEETKATKPEEVVLSKHDDEMQEQPATQKPTYYFEDSDESDETVGVDGEEMFDLSLFETAQPNRQDAPEKMDRTKLPFLHHVEHVGLSRKVSNPEPKRKRFDSDATVEDDQDNFQNAFFGTDVTRPSTITPPENNNLLFSPPRRDRAARKITSYNFHSDNSLSTTINDDHDISFDFGKAVTSTPVASRQRSHPKSGQRTTRGNSGTKRARGSRGVGRGSRGKF